MDAEHRNALAVESAILESRLEGSDNLVIGVVRDLDERAVLILPFALPSHPAVSGFCNQPANAQGVPVFSSACTLAAGRLGIGRHLTAASSAPRRPPWPRLPTSRATNERQSGRQAGRPKCR